MTDRYSLGEHFERFIEEQVASGRYATKVKSCAMRSDWPNCAFSNCKPCTNR